MVYVYKIWSPDCPECVEWYGDVKDIHAYLLEVVNSQVLTVGLNERLMSELDLYKMAPENFILFGCLSILGLKYVLVYKK